jgi:hypothetical protein
VDKQGKRVSGELVPQPSEGIRLLAQLEATGAITQTALILPPDTTYSQCEALAAMFGQLHRTSAWLIGDLMNHVEKVYGETVGQVAEVTGLSPGTVHNYTSVCAHIPRSRRRATLPFSTHAEVAYLPPEEQEKWLKEATSHKWTKAQLRLARKADLPLAVVECRCPTCGHTHTHMKEG